MPELDSIGREIYTDANGVRIGKNGFPLTQQASAPEGTDFMQALRLSQAEIARNRGLMNEGMPEFDALDPEQKAFERAQWKKWQNSGATGMDSKWRTDPLSVGTPKAPAAPAAPSGGTPPTPAPQAGFPTVNRMGGGGEGGTYGAPAAAAPAPPTAAPPAAAAPPTAAAPSQAAPPSANRPASALAGGRFAPGAGVAPGGFGSVKPRGVQTSMGAAGMR